MADLDLRTAFSTKVFDEEGIKVLYSGTPNSPVDGDRRQTLGTGVIEKYDGADWNVIGNGVEFLTVTPSGDDKGVNVSAELSVGSAAQGYEAIFGGGDSYPVPIAYHADIANTTGDVVTSATDVSTILQSDSSSTTGLFGSEAAGSYILVGSDYKYGGVKLKVDTVGDIEPENVVGEFLNGSSNWVTAPFMSTDANYPYTQNGNSIGMVAGSEQVRFGFNPLSLPIEWAKTDMTVNGVTENKYWARFRITSAITLDPLIEQLKLHTDRFEINADGNTEYFGRSRYFRSLNIRKVPNAAKNPTNENIKIAPGITALVEDNEFANGASDGFILTGEIPQGMDTSIPVQVVIDWYPKGTGSGDVELEFETAVDTGSFVYDGNASKVAQTPVITAVDDDEEVKQTSLFLVDVSNSVPGNVFYGSIFRDASSGNDDDTFASNIVIVDWEAIAYFWRP